MFYMLEHEVVIGVLRNSRREGMLEICWLFVVVVVVVVALDVMFVHTCSLAIAACSI